MKLIIGVAVEWQSSWNVHNSEEEHFVRCRATVCAATSSSRMSITNKMPRRHWNHKSTSIAYVKEQKHWRKKQSKNFLCLCLVITRRLHLNTIRGEFNCAQLQLKQLNCESSQPILKSYMDWRWTVQCESLVKFHWLNAGNKTNQLPSLQRRTPIPSIIYLPWWNVLSCCQYPCSKR